MKNLIGSLLFVINLNLMHADYWSLKKELINADNNYEVGANITLTVEERRVNSILMRNKLKEYDSGLSNPNTFLSQQHFFKAKEKIKKSTVFEILRQLPKGGSLHSHSTALVSQEFLYNLTFEENLYACIIENDITLHFFSEDNISNTCDWTLVDDLRRNNSTFDSFLKSKLTLIRADPDKYYADINTVWEAFEKIFSTISNLLSFKPVFQKYFYQSLKELHEDNVKYSEIRSSNLRLYDMDGTVLLDNDVIQLYVDTIRKFQSDYPDFIGCKYIYSPARILSESEMKKCVKQYKRMKKQFPEFVVGFDLVGYEDLGNPLDYYLPALLELKKFGAKFFFHAGETNWNGQPADLNLFDALLLNATRIGHGYALPKHPMVAKLVKERKIAVEVCPISNQVLKLVSDLRNHPGAIMIASGFPVVIAADDPSVWGAQGLSYDWYMAFMALTRRDGDLRVLKQLAINSIEYSSLDGYEKSLAMSRWRLDWDIFISNMLSKYT